MLTVRLLAVGKSKGDWAGSARAHFSKLLKRHCRFELVEIPEVKKSPDGSVDSLRRQETERVISSLRSDVVWLFDISGQRLSSEAYAALLSETMSGGAGSLDLIIGGACGLTTDAREKSDKVLSLSGLTLSHQVARVVVLEQLYRAFSILAGSAYHK